jgi:hypothetical protein
MNNNNDNCLRRKSESNRSLAFLNMNLTSDQSHPKHKKQHQQLQQQQVHIIPNPSQLKKKNSIKKSQTLSNIQNFQNMPISTSSQTLSSSKLIIYLRLQDSEALNR